MAQSLPPVLIPQSKWVDLYAETGITVGTKLIIQNAGESEADLTESVGEPIGKVGVNPIPPKEFFTNADVSVGAWAFSDRGTELQVEEA